MASKKKPLATPKPTAKPTNPSYTTFSGGNGTSTNGPKK